MNDTRLSVLVAAFLSLGAWTGNAQTPCPPDLAGSDFLAGPGERYKLAWHDEFDASQLDTGKWSIGLPWKGSEDGKWHNDHYASYIQPEDVNLAEGELHLTYRKLDIQGKTRTFHYTQGMVSTVGKYSFTYGYTEVRARAPLEAGKGIWPAFWTLAAGWPPEFDVIEIWTSEPRIHQGYCSARPGGGQRWDSYHAKSAPTGYHTYGMEWGPGYVYFNLDGRVTKRVYGAHVTSKAQYLILNSAVGSGKGNIAPDNSTIFPNSFDVQYCRVYQRPVGPAVLNGGFEYGEVEPWDHWGDVGIDQATVHSGGGSLRVGPRSTAEQTVYGLKPETDYELSGWAQGQILLGVKDYGGAQATTPAGGERYSRSSLRFRTGPANTTAVVFCFQPTGAEAAYVDDIALKELNTNQ